MPRTTTTNIFEAALRNDIERVRQRFNYQIDTWNMNITPAGSDTDTDTLTYYTYTAPTQGFRIITKEPRQPKDEFEMDAD